MNSNPAINMAKLRQHLENDIGLDIGGIDLCKIIDTLISREAELNSFEEIAAATAAMIAVHETHFLRHSDHFSWLTNHWLPQQVADGAIQLNILSAGCSTGEEPYSLAAQLLQAAKPYHLHINIDACDINKHSLQIARQGKYGLWSLRGVDVAREQEWLDMRARSVYVREPYKSKVNFFSHNLTKALPQRSYYDLILCRNVLIYMHPQAIATIYNNLRYAMKDTGVLIPGPSDPNPLAENELYLAWQQDVCTYITTPLSRSQDDSAQPLTKLHQSTRSTTTQKKIDKFTDETCDQQNPAAPTTTFCDHKLIGKMIKNGYYDAARSALISNIELDAFDVRSYTMLATLSLDMDDIQSAMEAGRKAAFLDSESCYTIYLNAEIKFRRGDETGYRNELLWAKHLLQSMPPASDVKYCEEIQASQLLDVINSRLNCSETL